MKNIIDDVKPISQKTKKIFSKLSFTIAMIEVLLIVLLFQISWTWNLNKTIGWAENAINPIVLASLIKIFILLGILFSILSFVKKEPNSFYKWIGAILNGLIFIIIIASIIFAFTIDNTR